MENRNDIKRRLAEYLNGIQLDAYSLILEGTDKRLLAYVRDVIEHADGHNLMELLAIWKFFKMRDEGYGWNRTKVRHFISTWQSYEYVDEGGSHKVKMSGFQCFVFANVYGWVRGIGTKAGLESIGEQQRGNVGDVSPLPGNGGDERQSRLKLGGELLVDAQRGSYSGDVGCYRRVVRDVLVYCPRKVGKSTMISGLASYELGYGPLNATVFVGANSADQAGILFGMIKNIYQSMDPEHTFSKVNRTKLWVEGKHRKAYAQAVANDSTRLDGKNPSCRIMDEIAQARLDQVKNSWLVRNVLDSGMTARTEPLRVDITTASTVLDSPFREYKEALEEELIQSFLEDRVLDPTNFAMIMQPDEGDAEDDPQTWLKVNPHLGETLVEGQTTVLLSNYESDYRKMSKTASGITEFRTKYLNVFAENQEKVWISADDVKKRMVGVSLDASERGRQCAVSFDLSQRDDFSCVCYTLFYQETRQFVCYLDYYLPEGTLPGHQNEQLYRSWVDAGYLHLCKGDVVDYVQIGNDILERAEFLDVRRVGFDANKAQELRNMLDNSPTLHDKLIPFSQTNGNYNIPEEIFERLFFGRMEGVPEGIPCFGILFNENPITSYCFGNAQIDEDRMGNKRPVKKADNRKIDATVCVLMGVGQWYELRR